MTSIHPDRHYYLLWGADNKLKLRVACGSGADVVVSQLRGALLMELEDEVADLWSRGPLVIDCERHGHYIGVTQLLPEAAPQDDHTPVKFDLLLMPVGTTEHATSLAGPVKKLVADGLDNAPSELRDLIDFASTDQ